MTEHLKKYQQDQPEPPQEERRDRTWFDELSEELEAHVNHIETRLQRFFTKALFAFAIIGVACAVSLFGFGLVLDAQSETSRKIQQQRYDSLLNACLDQNVRHDNVIKQIDAAVAAVPKRRKKRAKESAKPFKLILEAAVPYTKDCREHAASRVKGTV